MEAREVFRAESLRGSDGEEAVGARKTITVVPQVLPWLVIAVGLVYVVVTVLLVVAIKIQGVHSRSRDVIRSLATRRCLLSLLGLLLRPFTTRDTSPRVTCLGFLLPLFYASYTRRCTRYSQHRILHCGSGRFRVLYQSEDWQAKGCALTTTPG